MVEESHAPAQLRRTSSEPLRRRSFSKRRRARRYSGNEWQPPGCNQGGTVEYTLYPTPDFSGVGFCIPAPI